MDKFFGFLVELSPKIDEFLHSIPEKMRQVGSDLLVGLWNGISDKVAWLKGKVSGVVDKIKSWFTSKEGFDVHSPSRWAEDVFKNVMVGGANGLKYGESTLYRSANNVVERMKNGLDMSEVNFGNSRFGVATAQGINAANKGANPNISLTANLTLPDGRVLASFLLEDLIRVASASGTPILNPYVG